MEHDTLLAESVMEDLVGLLFEDHISGEAARYKKIAVALEKFFGFTVYNQLRVEGGLDLNWDRGFLSAIRLSFLSRASVTTSMRERRAHTYASLIIESWVAYKDLFAAQLGATRVSEGGIEYKTDRTPSDPSLNHSNGVAYKFILDLIARVKDGFRAPADYSSYAKFAHQISEIRSRGHLSETIQNSRAFNEALDVACALMYLSEIISEHYSKESRFTSALERNYAVVTGEVVESTKPRHVEMHATTRMEKIGYTGGLLGRIVSISISGTTSIMTRVHLGRVISMLKSFAAQTISSVDILTSTSPTAFLDLVHEVVSIIGTHEAKSIPHVIKGAKTLLISRLEARCVLPKTSRAYAISELEGIRKRLSPYVAKVILRHTRSIEDAINASNFYKALPHPDYDEKSLLQTITALHEPNHVNKSCLRVFQGRTRKVIAESLNAQGMTVKLSRKDYVPFEDAPAVDSLIQKSRGASRRFADLLRYTDVHWSYVKLEVCESLVKPSEVKLNVKSKASAPDSQDADPLETMTLEESAELMRNVDDVVQFSLSKSYLKTEKHIARFRKVVEAHVKHERRNGVTINESENGAYIVDEEGLTPEDIPINTHVRFLRGTKSARYSVSTDGKYGEKHKLDTRVFYLAERKLKTITQVFERTVKQITRKQKGASITQTARDRRKYVEDMARSMMAMGTERLPIYVSFDMSEFSKKFPMALIRAYAEVVSEVTGDPWCSRIDLVFRSAIVYMSKRHIYGTITGPYGGFEGFLNFTWTSIHDIVMTLALESVGLAGTLTTYSDDGLLMFLAEVQDSKEDIERYINRIQEFYREHGLIFKLSKTAVSGNYWEFLGDVAYNGKIIPQYIKELSRVGTDDSMRALNPYFSKIESLTSQANSAITHQLCPLVASTIAHVTVAIELQRKFPVLLLQENRVALVALLVLPGHYGGFGVRAYPENSLITTIETEASVISDLKLIQRVYPSYVNQIMKRLIDNSFKSKSPGESLYIKHYSSVSYRTFTARGILNEAIRLINDQLPGRKLETDPFKGKLGKILDKAALTYRGFRPGVLGDILMTFPEVVRYQSALEIARSTSALKLIRKQEIMKLQSKDSRNVEEALHGWTGLSRTSKRYSILDSFTDMMRKTYPSVAMMPPREGIKSSVICSTHLKEGLGELIALSTAVSPAGLSIGSAESLESVERYIPPVTRLRWQSEADGSDNRRALLTFIDSVAQVVAACPELGPLVSSVISLAGYTESIPVSVLTTNMYRAKRSGATALKLQGNLQSTLSVTPIGELLEYFTRTFDSAVDRTTIVDTMKYLSYASVREYGSRSVYSVRRPSSLYIYKRGIYLEEIMLVTNITLRPGAVEVDHYDMPRRDYKDFYESLALHAASMSDTASITNAMITEANAESITLVSTIVTSELSYALKEIALGRPERVSLPQVMSWMSSEIIRSIIRSTLQVMRPQSRSHLECEFFGKGLIEVDAEAIDDAVFLAVAGRRAAKLKRAHRNDRLWTNFNPLWNRNDPDQIVEERSDDMNIVTDIGGENDVCFEVGDQAPRPMGDGFGDYSVSINLISDIFRTCYPMCSLPPVDDIVNNYLDILKDEMLMTHLSDRRTVVITTPEVSNVAKVSTTVLSCLKRMITSSVNNLKFVTRGDQLAAVRETITVLEVIRSVLHPSTHRDSVFNMSMAKSLLTYRIMLARVVRWARRNVTFKDEDKEPFAVTFLARFTGSLLAKYGDMREVRQTLESIKHTEMYRAYRMPRLCGTSAEPFYSEFWASNERDRPFDQPNSDVDSLSKVAQDLIERVYNIYISRMLTRISIKHISSAKFNIMQMSPRLVFKKLFPSSSSRSDILTSPVLIKNSPEHPYTRSQVKALELRSAKDAAYLDIPTHLLSREPLLAPPKVMTEESDGYFVTIVELSSQSETAKLLTDIVYSGYATFSLSYNPVTEVFTALVYLWPTSSDTPITRLLEEDRVVRDDLDSSSGSSPSTDSLTERLSSLCSRGGPIAVNNPLAPVLGFLGSLATPSRLDEIAVTAESVTLVDDVTEYLYAAHSVSFASGNPVSAASAYLLFYAHLRTLLEMPIDLESAARTIRNSLAGRSRAVSSIGFTADVCSVFQYLATVRVIKPIALANSRVSEITSIAMALMAGVSFPVASIQGRGVPRTGAGFLAVIGNVIEARKKLMGNMGDICWEMIDTRSPYEEEAEEEEDYSALRYSKATLLPVPPRATTGHEETSDDESNSDS